MSTFSDYSPGKIGDFRERLHASLKERANLQEMAQTCARLLYEEFTESLILARVFVTLPFSSLPARDKAFVTALAEAKNLAPLLGEKTQVLSLLGTHGAEARWNDRYQSQDHLGIPLLTAEFVESIPMVARLMSDMGIGSDWFDKFEPDILVKNLGRAAGVFYVRDAKMRLDARNRKIVSAQDFVAAHDIHTVFGLGGSYLNGSFVTIILFTRETIEQSQAEAFMLLVNTFKTATLSFVMDGAIFPHSDRPTPLAT
ncbi:MAG TPA: hypothetical protein VEX70_14735 [Pyrinomonadaceae bacterium]|nr:hypothetical protein [Pyrinomonadaceae bacterium]